MRARVFADPQALATALARHIAGQLRRRPRFVLGLPTGRTPLPLYRRLIDLHRRAAVDFSTLTTFNVDEFVGLAAGDAGSYREFMQRCLFEHINVRPRRIHFLNGRAPDVGAECRRYERTLRRAGGLDLLLLGLGGNGHIGFNEPGRALVARTHRATLTHATRLANRPLFGTLRAVPRQGLTMGMATILEARRIVLIATGAGKARCVQRMIEGPITTTLPASLLQLHGGVEVWVDRVAGAELQAG